MAVLVVAGRRSHQVILSTALGTTVAVGDIIGTIGDPDIDGVAESGAVTGELAAAGLGPGTITRGLQGSLGDPDLEGNLC